jgi:hypothetical protein
VGGDDDFRYFRRVKIKTSDATGICATRGTLSASNA